jgi:uncharacterized protein
VRRLRERGHYERATLHAILDEAFYCHVGFVAERQPYVVPTIHARDGERLYIHGSVASRMLKSLRGGISVCVTVTLLDGLVLARSAFHHSMNYRSVMVLGTAVELAGAPKLRALERIVERVLPGRCAEVRGPNAKELKATTVLALPIEEASAKIRTGPPADAQADYALPYWAGVLPLRVVAGEPQPDARLAPGQPLSAALAGWRDLIARRAAARD